MAPARSPQSARSSQSSYQEMLIEHLFTGDLLRTLWPRHAEVLKPQVDDGGYDLVVEVGSIIRHIQLKTSKPRRENGKTESSPASGEEAKRLRHLDSVRLLQVRTRAVSLVRRSSKRTSSQFVRIPYRSPHQRRLNREETGTARDPRSSQGTIQ